MYSGKLIDELFDAVEKAERSAELAPKEDPSTSGKCLICAQTRANIEQYFREQYRQEELQPK